MTALNSHTMLAKSDVMFLWSEEAKMISCCNDCGGSFFSVCDFLKCFTVWIWASYSHREWRTDTTRQLFFLQALNVCVETSFLLGLLKWAIAVSASYLRQESFYCFSTALQQATDLQWPGVYSVSHNIKHLELADLLNIQQWQFSKHYKQTIPRSPIVAITFCKYSLRKHFLTLAGHV